MKMNNTILIIGAVAVGGYLYMKSRKTNAVAQATQEGEEGIGGGGGGGGGGSTTSDLQPTSAPVVVVDSTTMVKPDKPTSTTSNDPLPIIPTTPTKPTKPTSAPIVQAPTSKFVDFDGEFASGSGLDFDGELE